MCIILRIFAFDSWILSLKDALEVVLILHLLILSESHRKLRFWLSDGRLLVLRIRLFLLIFVLWPFNMKHLHIVVQWFMMFVSFWFVLWCVTCRKQLSVCWFPSIGENIVFAMSNGIVIRWCLGCLGANRGVCNGWLTCSCKHHFLILTFGCQDLLVKSNIL